jgi:hypothetical protein
MIVLGRIEGATGLDLCDNRSIEYVRLVQLGDVGLGNARLLGTGWEDCGAVLSADIRSLAMEFGRVMGDRKIDLQNPAIADAVRVEGDLDRFRVSGGVAANHFVMRGIGCTTGIARDGTGDAFDMLKDALDAPEAAAGEAPGLDRREMMVRLMPLGPPPSATPTGRAARRFSVVRPLSEASAEERLCPSI